MKRFPYLIIISLVFVIAACQNEKHEEGDESKFLVTSPQKMDTVFYKEYVSQIHSVNHIELRSQEKGYLKNIFVDEGQAVKKGQLMFQLTPLIYQAEAEKAIAEANFAEIEYQNTKALADSNIVSSKELALAKARLEKAKAEVALAQAHLSFTDVRAPFDGIMGRFEVRLGSLVEEGELLTTLSDNSRMWVYFNVPETEYLDYVTKSKSRSPEVKLQLANKELFEHTGIVETIEGDFNNETGNIAFRATFPNPKGILRHGETGNILMPVPVRNALLIPQKATFEILDKKYVFILDKENVLKTVEIEIAEEISHLYAVKEGLKAEDKILIEGLRKVKNNQKIHADFVSFSKVLKELAHLHAE